MTALKVGSESWWQSKHGPEWQRLNDEMFEVTFWWRDPQGSEEYSTIKARMGLYHWRDRSPSEQPAPVDGSELQEPMFGSGRHNSMPTGVAATALFLLNAMTFFLHHPPIASNYAKAGENYYPRR